MPQHQGKLHIIGLTSYPIQTIVSTSLILDYWRGSQPVNAILAIGANIPTVIPLPVKEFDKIGRVPLVPPLHERLDLGQ